MDELISKFSVGRLDLLPKVAYADMEEEMGDDPQFMWWGLFMIETNQPLEIQSPFCIIDNVDEFGSVFLIKDTRVIKPIIINKGVCPAIHSLAEMNKNEQWFYVGLSMEREQIVNTFKELTRYCRKVELICNTIPIKLLRI